MDAVEHVGPEPKRARIEIIPLIDVIFFLLATFVLFTLSLQRMTQLEAGLPGVDGKGEIDDRTLFIQVSADDTLYWKKGSLGVAESMSAFELRPRIEEYARNAGDARVFIRSDRRAKLGAAVRVLDEVRRAGIKQVAIETISSAPGS